MRLGAKASKNYELKIMQIYVNNKPVSTEAGSLGALAVELSLPEKGVAVAVEGKMVPRTQWEQTPLSEGAHIVIIKAACGG